MPRILIAGAGVGGLTAAHQLRKRLPNRVEILVFDRSSEHTFWPSLLWLMTGSRGKGDVVRPLSALKSRGIQVVLGAITALDPANKVVVAGDRRYVGDFLIIALGADLDATAIPGLADEPGNFYSVPGAEAVWSQLQSLTHGRVVVLVSRVPFKCPAAPYEAAMLIDGYLRKRRRRDAVEVQVWAAEPAPMGVAGAHISDSVVKALRDRGIAYEPNRLVTGVDAQRRQLQFSDGTVVSYDLLAYVPPHRVPEVVVAAKMASADGWVKVDRYTLETEWPGVYAIGDVTGIALPMGKPLPKAGVFAHRQGEMVAETIAARLLGTGQERKFDGFGECFIEMGGGVAGFARGDFYAEPTPAVRLYQPGRHWHAGKVAFERHWWAQWW